MADDNKKAKYIINIDTKEFIGGIQKKIKNVMKKLCVTFTKNCRTFLIEDVVIEICGSKLEHSKNEAYSKAFAAYTLYGWIEVWF